MLLYVENKQVLGFWTANMIVQAFIIFIGISGGDSAIVRLGLIE